MTKARIIMADAACRPALFDQRLCIPRDEAVTSATLKNLRSPAPFCQEYVTPGKKEGTPWMPAVKVKENEPFDVALRRFKRSCETLWPTPTCWGSRVVRRWDRFWR